MRSSRKTITGLMIATSLVVGGCSLVGSLGALTTLRRRLIQKYHDEVAVNLQNSRYLSVVFVNSPLNNQDQAKRIERAQDAARFVALNYEEIKSIEAVWISFMVSETRLIVFHHNQIIDAFPFDRNGASLQTATVRNNAVVYDEARKETDDRAPVLRYLTSTDQTEISVTRIQLEGDMNRGIALVPHFIVAGDARKLGTAIGPPEFVVLDFASYSDKPIFQPNPPLEAYCDGRLALKGFAALVPSAQSGTDESIAQFLSVRISFKLLQKMAKSEHVKIILGPRQFELRPDDINALAQMAAYVPSSNDGQ